MRRNVSAEPAALHITCPEWAHPGDRLQLEVGSARLRFAVSVPSDVNPGDVFTVKLPGVADGERTVRVLREQAAQVAVLCPPGKIPGDTITIHPEGHDALQVVVPVGTAEGSSFMVQLPQNGSRDEPPRSRLARARALCFPTCYMIMIWTVVSANYVLHVFLRERRWNMPVFCGGHLILAIQVAAYVATMRTPPGSVPASWHAAAAMGVARSRGKVKYVVDGRTGQRLPLRARHVFRAGDAVLGFDHFCFWLGVPIGLRNRKPFVLFLCYSWLLVTFALGLFCVDFNSVSARDSNSASPMLPNMLPNTWEGALLHCWCRSAAPRPPRFAIRVSRATAPLAVFRRGGFG